MLLSLLSFLSLVIDSDANKSAKVFLRRECAEDADGDDSCGIAVRGDFADATEVGVLRAVAAMTAERAVTDAALSVFDFESNGITHGDGFATFGDRHKLRHEGKACVRGTNWMVCERGMG